MKDIDPYNEEIWDDDEKNIKIENNVLPSYKVRFFLILNLIILITTTLSSILFNIELIYMLPMFFSFIFLFNISK